MKKTIAFSCISFFASSAFSQKQVNIDLNQVFQEIEGFAASDCWTGNYIGQWEGGAPANAAKWLFSSELKSNGDPHGIGLSMWRVNLGAGTAEQGEASTITDISRRAECFMNPDGTYDWGKLKGQQYFCDQALNYGCNNFVLFSNSPLVYFTRNGLGTSPGDWKSNLNPDRYPDFAGYLTEVADYFIREKGMNISYISPVNEPQYQWTGGGQEGTPWTNAEIKKLVVELDKSILEKELPVKILITEAGDWNRLLQGGGHADSQLFNFWNTLSPNYIGGIETLDKTVGAHSYWLDRDNETLRNVRQNVGRKVADYGLKCHQTEWSLLSETPIEGFPASYGEATYTDIALQMAKVIHADLTYANVSSWSFWTSMDMERWGHKNRFSLLKVIPSDGDNGSILKSGKITTHKTLWALGNYSLFIRPGYKRIELTGADDLSTLAGSAYVSPDRSKLVAVYVNMSKGKESVCTKLSNFGDLQVKERKMYRTCSLMDLKCVPINTPYQEGETIDIPARSVITMVYTLEPQTTAGVGHLKTINSENITVYPNPVSDNRFYVKQKFFESPVRSSLFTRNGQRVCDLQFDSAESSFKIPQGVPADFYLFRVQDQKNCYHARVQVR